MPILLQQILGGVLRTAFAALSGMLVQRGWLNPADQEELIVGLIGLTLTVLWSVWQKYKSRLALLIGLHLAPGSEPDTIAKAGPSIVAIAKADLLK